MSKFPLHRQLPNKNLSFQIAKFPYPVDFSSFSNPIVRKKTLADEDQIEDTKEEIKRGSKMAGHIGTSDKKYFGDRISQKREKEQFILDTKVPEKALFEGVYTESERNTCYYAFVMIDNQFHAIPVHENWLHFKPMVKSTISSDQAEEILVREKEKREKLLSSLRLKEEEDNQEYTARTGIKLEDGDLDDDDLFGDEEDEEEDDDREFKNSVKTSKQLKKQQLGETGKKLKKLLNYDSDKEDAEDEKSQESDSSNSQKSPKPNEKGTSGDKKKRKKEGTDLPPEKKIKVEKTPEVKEEESLDEIGQMLAFVDKYILENKPTTQDMQNRIKSMIKDKGAEGKKMRDLIVQHLKNTTQTILNDKKEKIIVRKN